ncbi:hypothetical protein [Streptomyces sp. NPDC002889]|uniref:hypothetical protein n=1 Tax=Streptomyces sp. NPDC002889 TaxID=3364669 RepID=UPI0036B41E5F
MEISGLHQNTGAEWRSPEPHEILMNFISKETDRRSSRHATECRSLTSMIGQTEAAPTLETAGPVHPDGPLFGPELDRWAALKHRRLSEFWRVADFILKHDPLIRGHVYGC